MEVPGEAEVPLEQDPSATCRCSFLTAKRVFFQEFDATRVETPFPAKCCATLKGFTCANLLTVEG